ncbi:cyanophycinase-like [Saccostrea cucullata]|uniref:cyanophycinase-like n=1 Tax=Saccostrea cuccullata TaxID=36930 RepID=UPI002ECFB6E9
MAAILVLVTSVLLAGCSAFVLDGAFLPQYYRYGRSLVLVGGNLAENNSEIYNTIIELSGGRGVAKIGIINAASLDPVGGYQYYRDLFLKFGALEANRIPIDVNHTHANADPQVVSLVREQTGFFFGGGDQQRIIDTFYNPTQSGLMESPVLAALRERFNIGAVVAGTSAGTECQPNKIMINSGESWEALRYGVHTSYSDKRPHDLVYNPRGGLGFLDGFIIDAHFSERGREGRLAVLLDETRRSSHISRGFGVDENTALVVTHAESDAITGKVIGQNGVVFIDVSHAHHDPHSTYYSVSNVIFHYLTNGDLIGLRNLNITFSPTKTPMRGHEAYDHALTSSDIFYGKHRDSSHKPEFTRAATSVFDSRLDSTTYGDTYESHPTFRVTMTRTSYSVGYVERKSSFHSDITSYENLVVSIAERK